MHVRAVAIGFLGAVLGTAPVSAAAQTAAPVPTRVVRCYPAADVPCALAGATLNPEEARREPNDSTARWWSGRLAGARLAGFHEAVDTTNPAPWKLLILLDLSGSMRGEGLRYARTGLRGFINGLPSVAVSVAVAPFESRQVAARIAGAQFGPPSDGVRVLDALPPPDAAGNTALYSALVAGLARLDKEMQGAAPGTRSGLVLLTDGKNDVRGASDDPGLLSGASGRQQAAATAAKSSHEIWLVGVGNVDPGELSALAGDRGEALVDALNAVALGSRLSHIGRQIAADREVALRIMSPSLVLLARSGGAGTLIGGANPTGAGEAAVVRRLDWHPPLLALPAYDGVADPKTLPTAMASSAGLDADWSRWVMVSICLALLWLALTATLPHLLATPIGSVPAEGAVVARESVAQQSAATAASQRDERSTGLRVDAKEAPARRPDEITASSARKVSTTT